MPTHSQVTSQLSLVSPLQETEGPSVAQKLSAMGAAAMMTLSSFSGVAMASEFDLLAESTPTNSYYLDDASVLSVSTKGDINKKLKDLEVRGRNSAHAHTRTLQLMPR